VSHQGRAGELSPSPPGGGEGSPPGTPHRGGADVTVLFRERQAELVHLASLLLGSRPAAEDVVQDVFTRLCAKDRLPAGDAALPYARAAVVNGCRSALRRRSLSRRVGARRETSALELTQGSAEDEVLRAEERRTVLLALGGLPQRRREVLVLRYWLGLTESEIGSALGISVGTVRSTAARGLAAVARKLKENA
jgi:RNA polymerase sigma factor (sigma-70 family)